MLVLLLSTWTIAVIGYAVVSLPEYVQNTGEVLSAFQEPGAKAAEVSGGHIALFLLFHAFVWCLGGIPLGIFALLAKPTS
jgi:hypothetical protein